MGKKRRRPLNGRHMLTLGALALAGLSGYELWIRVEDFWAWTAGIRHLSAVRGTPFWQDLAIVFEAPEMRALGCKMLFLAATLIFAILCLVRRSRARGAWLLMVMDAAVAGFGLWLGLYTFDPSNWAQLLKLLPLLLILAGCITNYAHRAVLRRRKRQRAALEKREHET